MVQVRYKALDAAGRFITGTLDGASEAEVAARLNRSGHVVLETASGRVAGDRTSFFSLRGRVGGREITTFFADLALVLRAGLPLDEALDLVASEERSGIAAVARDLRRSVTGGASFAEAMGGHGRLFGSDVITMVRVAEAAGTLDRVLASVAEARARSEKMVETISASLRYPAFLLVAASGVLIFFLLAVVPQFAGVLRDFGAAQTGVVGFVLAASDFLVAEGDLVAAGAAAVLAAGLLIFRRPAARARLAAMVMRLPGLSGLAALRRTTVFCGGLATLLANGVTLTEALRVLGDLPGATGSGLTRVSEGVRRGKRLVEAIAEETYLPPLALNMLRLGEETGELAEISRRIADFYETKLTARLERLSGIVGPAAIIGIAVMVGGLIVSILSALLSINQLVL
jgi:general secretion pathway protein F